MRDVPGAKEAMELVNWEREEAQETKRADLERGQPRGLRCDLRGGIALENVSKLQHSEWNHVSSLDSSVDDWSSSLAFKAGVNESLAIRLPQPGETVAFKCAKDASMKEMRLKRT